VILNAVQRLLLSSSSGDVIALRSGRRATSPEVLGERAPVATLATAGIAVAMAKSLKELATCHSFHSIH